MKDFDLMSIIENAHPSNLFTVMENINKGLDRLGEE